MSFKRTMRKVKSKMPSIQRDPRAAEDRFKASEHMERVTRATDAFDALTDDEKEAFMLYHHLKYDERGPRKKPAEEKGEETGSPKDEKEGQ